MTHIIRECVRHDQVEQGIEARVGSSFSVEVETARNPGISECPPWIPIKVSLIQ